MRKASILIVSLTASWLPASSAAQVITENVVVTAPRMSEPLTVVSDPKAPRQPIPANDGADYLKSVPGFSVIRKGGTSGDPVFRGMAGSRINILLDDELILGGCSMRMDPPTAYVYPDSYDRMTIIKGPQTVLYGAGNSAATVRFERDHERYEAPGSRFYGSATVGSFGRLGALADLGLGNPDVYARAIATLGQSDDYKDGDGVSVHSAYKRWSANLAMGWTPTDDSRMEVSVARSDGEAAYADRAMDGVRFARENVGLTGEFRNVSALIEELELRIYRNYIDHVMDNYSLRTFTPSMMMPFPTVSNPDRDTVGARGAGVVRITGNTLATVGLDYQANQHSNRFSRNEPAMPYESMARTEDANFKDIGVFGELRHDLSSEQRVIAGLRYDWWRAEDQRSSVNVGMASLPNPTAGEVREESAPSGFGRYEQDFGFGTTTVYAGLGYSERMPDYWELISNESADSVSAFDTQSEKTTQLDAGMLYAMERWTGSLSAFYNRVDDFILIESNYTKPAGMMGTRSTSITRNIDAATWGLEAGLGYELTGAWKIGGSVAYVRGENETDGLPLAQLPPLEGRISLDYDNDVWVFGALLRLAAAQDRVAVDQGNIVGQDLGPTPGFGVFSVNGGWRPKDGVLIVAGVDNLFDKTYAEHISRAGASVAGFEQTTRVNEPGRVLWLRANLALD